MNMESINGIALGGTVLVNLVVALVLLHVKNSVLEALTIFRKECDDKYESKELAQERLDNLNKRLDSVKVRS